ncbi:hypothetical protein [Nonomuraea insulae]|uniref:Uncharacterized protein n=1 Tax=Nonomuraea insulae TaxID=1616787 RepID=A0ABW1CUZ7_9ACTN
MSKLARRYVHPGKDDVRRYLKLLHGNFLTLPEPVFRSFAGSLAKDVSALTQFPHRRAIRSRNSPSDRSSWTTV